MCGLLSVSAFWHFEKLRPLTNTLFGIPRVLSPKCFQCGVATAKNVAFSSSDVSHGCGKTAPGSQIAFAIAAVLPHVPTAPGRCMPRFGMIVSDPEPAICEDFAMRAGSASSIQHLSETVFTPVQTRILAGLLFDPFNESDRLGHAHRTSWIMTVFFEIQNEQHTRSRLLRTADSRCSHRMQKVISLPDGVRRVAVVISSP